MKRTAMEDTAALRKIMTLTKTILLLCTGTLVALAAGFAADATVKSATIVITDEAPAPVRLSAKELRRYIYLRTGALLQLAPEALDNRIVLTTDTALPAQQYRFNTDGDTLAIIAETTGGAKLVWPATAPQINQTVVITQR